LENKKLELSIMTCNLRETMKHVVKMNEKRAYDKNIYIQLIISKNVPEYVYVDQGRLIQILMNLVGNAVKFTEKGGVFIKIDWFVKENSDVLNIGRIIEVCDRYQILNTVSGKKCMFKLDRND
jgi:signal transduction histidine kinase